MFKQKLLVATLPLLLILATTPYLPLAQELTLPEDPLRGRLLFYQKGCLGCHSIRGEGGKVGPDLSKGGQSRSVTQLAGTMWNHFPKMSEKMKQMGIPYPRFTSNEMAELIAYIYFVGYFDEPATLANRLEGKTLFRAKGCINCHYIEGEGGTTGTDLTRWKRFASPILWAQLMWNHSPDMSEKMREKDVSRPQFKSREMMDLIAYVYGASGPPGGDVIYTLPANPARGKRLFEEKSCAYCHSIFGKGGDIGPSISAKHYDRALTRLAGIMWNHSLAMFEKMEQEGIPYPRFSGSEMADVIAYLFFLGYFDRPGNPARGKEVFVDKGCTQCHRARGEEGGNVGPDLTKYSSAEEPLQPVLITQALWNHAPIMAEAVKKKRMSWPRFEKQDMNDLLAFIGGTGDAN